MNENILVAGAGIGLSLLFGFVGGFKEWFEAQPGVRKAQVMLGLTLLAAAVVAAASCWLDYTWMTCDEGGFKKLVELFAWAILGNQTAYQTLVKPRG